MPKKNIKLKVENSSHPRRLKNVNQLSNNLFPTIKMRSNHPLPVFFTLHFILWIYIYIIHGRWCWWWWRKEKKEERKKKFSFHFHYFQLEQWEQKLRQRGDERRSKQQKKTFFIVYVCWVCIAFCCCCFISF